MKGFLSLILILSTHLILAQTGVIKGSVVDSKSNEPLPFANLKLIPGDVTVTTNFEGAYSFENLIPGSYSIEVRYAAYQPKAITDISVSNAFPVELVVQLNSALDSLDALIVRASPFSEEAESPVSLRNLSAEEIKRFPGANRDVSKVVQSLPGFSPQPSFRNDIVIRGGAPNENRFYLDDIEVPNINHFATQGSSGGPVGLININFINAVNFYSGAFPANRGNALSSVIDFKQKAPNKSKSTTTFTLGSSDAGLTLDTPLGKKTGLILSVRRSYLQFLFQALQLPFLPTYTDAQFKLTHDIDNKNKLTFVGLGALDFFAINTNVNDGISDPETLERNNFILGNLPTQDQWNYAIGGKYRHFRDNGFNTLVVSRNHLANFSKKYQDNDETDPSKLLLDYASQEIETKIRYENYVQYSDYKLIYGVGLEHVTYTNQTFNRIFTPNGPQTIDFNSKLNFFKYSLFGQLSREWRLLTLSFGLRSDVADYSSNFFNPIDQLSPRISASYKLTEKWALSANIGRYSQLPAYTILGYENSLGVLENKNRVNYIDVWHYVAGFKRTLGQFAQISIEGFYKDYSDYPFSINDSVSLANLGANFGVIGNEPVSSESEGRSYGLELTPSSWDNRHVVSLTGGKKFKKNWDAGIRWLFSGGSPYTPYDVETSALKNSWDVRGLGLLDYNRLNSQRTGAFHQLDVRVDKKWFFKKWSLNVYLDIQNIYGFAAEVAPVLVLDTDADGNAVEDPNDSSRYLLKELPNSSGTVLPTIGIIIEF